MGKMKTTSTVRPRQQDEKDIKQIWIKFKKRSTEKVRNQLMERFLPLVKYNA